MILASARPGPGPLMPRGSEVSATLSGSLKAGSLGDSEAGATGTGPPRAHRARPSDGPRFVRGRGRSPVRVPDSHRGVRALRLLGSRGPGLRQHSETGLRRLKLATARRGASGGALAPSLSLRSGQRACSWRPWARPEAVY
jgi:hypothetical protein